MTRINQIILNKSDVEEIIRKHFERKGLSLEVFEMNKDSILIESSEKHIVIVSTEENETEYLSVSYPPAYSKIPNNALRFNSIESAEEVISSLREYGFHNPLSIVDTSINLE